MKGCPGPLPLTLPRRTTCPIIEPDPFAGLVGPNFKNTGGPAVKRQHDAYLGLRQISPAPPHLSYQTKPSNLLSGSPDPEAPSTPIPPSTPPIPSLHLYSAAQRSSVAHFQRRPSDFYYCPRYQARVYRPSSSCRTAVLAVSYLYLQSLKARDRLGPYRSRLKSYSRIALAWGQVEVESGKGRRRMFGRIWLRVPVVRDDVGGVGSVGCVDRLGGVELQVY